MASGKTLQSTIEISGVLSPSLQAAINSAVSKLSDMAEETLDSADAASRLVAEMSEQEDILKALKKAYAGYSVEGKESSEEAQKLAQKIQDVSGELSENKQKLDAAERAADSFGNELDEAGDSAEDSSEGFTILKGAIADLAADAIRSAIDGFKELATEGDTALAMLEARTGATGEEMEGFEDIMYEVYNANYGESLGDVADTLSTVKQMTDDLDNAQLAQITKNSIALSDVFGFDTTESLRAVNSLMDQFGITSDEAYNLIVQGAQNGLNQNDDLLDTINEYAVQFKGAGYSADDMFNMLANGTESGTWSVDKLGDAVKEFNIRMSDGTANEYLEELGVDADAVVAKFNKGGPEAQEAIDTVMKAIMECDDATLQYQTGVGIFGTMWEDLGGDTVASLMQTEGAISSAKDAMGQMNDAAYDTLEGSLSQLGRTVKAEVIQPIAEKLTPVLKNAVQFITSKVGPAVDWLVDKLPYLGVALGTVGAVIAAMKWGSLVSQLSKVGGAFTGLFSKIGAIPAPVKVVIGVIAALAAAFAYLWNNNEEFRNNVSAIWGELQGSFSELGGTISSVISQLAPIISQLASTFMTAFAQIAEALIPVLLQIISDILPIIIDLINQLLPVIMEIITAVLPIIVDLINQLLPIIMQIIEMVLPVIVDLLKQILPVIMQIIEAVLPILVKLIKAILPIILKIVEAVLPILVKILNAIMPILEAIISFLQPILSLIISLITPIINLITQAITPLVNIFTTLIESILKPLTPIITTIANIFSTVLGGAIKAIQPVIQALTGVFQGLIDFVTNVFKGNWKGAWDGIVKIFKNIWDGIVAIFKTPINWIIDGINSFLKGLNKIKIPDWVPGVGGKGLNIPLIPRLATGGFTDGISIAGEAGMEAVISFDPAYHERNVGIWEKAGEMLGVYDRQEQGAGLTATAGKLLALDDFSLGSLAGNTSVVYYYDFSGFTWSPQVHANGSDGGDSFMAKLKAHEAEFFDWLEEFIHMREEAQYA